MKPFFKSIFALGIVWLFSSVVFAQSSIDPMNLPMLTQWVTDFSNTLSASQLDELNASAELYESQSSNQLVAVIFPNRNGNELIDIGMKIFTDNGIGRKDVNNGLLLLISSEEKKIRIIVWYGLEWVYPDLIAWQLIENDIRPLVNSGDIAGAIKVFYEKSQQIIWWEIPVDYSTTSDSENSDVLYIFMFFGFILGFLLRSLYKKRDKRNILPEFANNFWIALVAGVVVIIILTLITQFVLYFIVWIFFGLWWIWIWRWGGFGWWFGWGWWFSWGWGWSGGGGAGD